MLGFVRFASKIMLVRHDTFSLEVLQEAMKTKILENMSVKVFYRFFPTAIKNFVSEGIARRTAQRYVNRQLNGEALKKKVKYRSQIFLDHCHKDETEEAH